MTNISEIKHTDDNNIIYHYTTIEALQGMLFGNKELWLGDSSFMNDTKELTEFIDRLKTRSTALYIIYIRKIVIAFFKKYTSVQRKITHILCLFQRDEMTLHSGNAMRIMLKEYV